MKKLIAMFVAVAAVSTAVATDSYIYWMAESRVGDIDFAYAQLVADNGSKVVISDLYSNEGAAATHDSHVSGVWSDSLASYGAGYNYYIELLNGDEDVVWTGYQYSYADIVAKGGIYTKGTPAGSPLDMGAVPEPTSGLMMLLGLALLGLKRKKA